MIDICKSKRINYFKMVQQLKTCHETLKQLRNVLYADYMVINSISIRISR